LAFAYAALGLTLRRHPLAPADGRWTVL